MIAHFIIVPLQLLLWFRIVSCFALSPDHECRDAGPDECQCYAVHEDDACCIRSQNKGCADQDFNDSYRHVKRRVLHFLFFLLPEYDHQDAAEQDVDGKHKRKHVGNQREYHADKHPDAEYYVEQGNKQMPEGTVARINLEKADYLERAAQDEYESCLLYTSDAADE